MKMKQCSLHGWLSRCSRRLYIGVPDHNIPDSDEEKLTFVAGSAAVDETVFSGARTGNKEANGDLTVCMAPWCERRLLKMWRSADLQIQAKFSGKNLAIRSHRPLFREIDDG